MTLRLEAVTKRFGNFTAVDGVSFTIESGTMFGLVGSNGAGKTTTMRMILRILLPDSGSVTWRDRPVSEQECRSFGYLPEERGLYPKMRVADQLAYLATLHGLHPVAARTCISGWLERLGLAEYRDKRVEQLSKGNQQKVQFVAAVAHRPPLVILDEPFSGLDPLNALALQDSLRQLQAEGTTLIFSSHRLDQVEQLCTHVALIHRARLMVSGPLREIKRQAGRQVVRLAAACSLSFLDRFPGVNVAREAPDYVELKVPSTTDPQEILRAAMVAGPVSRFELGDPSLEEIYLEKVGGVPA